MLTAYMDDSGSHDGSHNCTVAGYWGGVKKWKHLEWMWKQELARFGVSEFHAQQFWQNTGEYTSWDTDTHSLFINALLKIITDTEIVPFAFGVLGGEWNKQPVEYRRTFTRSVNPRLDCNFKQSLFLPFQDCIIAAGGHCRPGKQMNFVFDEDSEISSRLLNCYIDLKHDCGNDSRLGCLTFAPSHVAIPLQTADLLAFEVHRFTKKIHNDLAYRPRVEFRQAIVNIKRKDDFGLWDESRFIDLKTYLGGTQAL